jgi:hypothetical protein
MPYIKQDAREKFEDYGSINMPKNAGELNYMITQLLIEYMKNKPLNYQTINDIIGAIEGAKQEFYRRVAVPYEDDKIRENGDVY